LTACRTPRPRRRAPALATAIFCLVGCSTTHVLHLGDRAAARQIEETYLRPGTVVELTPIAGAAPPALKYDVVGPATGGLLVSDGSGVPTFARFDYIQRIETIDRSHGAGDGALMGGVSGFISGVAIAAMIAHDDAQANGSPSPSPISAPIIAVGVLLGLVGAGIGALYGAAAGHHDVYIIQP